MWFGGGCFFWFGVCVGVVWVGSGVSGCGVGFFGCFWCFVFCCGVCVFSVCVLFLAVSSDAVLFWFFVRADSGGREMCELVGI
ncbi:hypothetical protein, partial [Acinetobacter baumannii]